MPSFTYSPASLAWGGGTVLMTPVRLEYTAAALAWAGSTTVGVGPNLGSSLAEEFIRLDRLMRGDQIQGSDGVSQRFQRLWQETVEKIERAFEYVNSVNTTQQATLDALTAAQALAASAKQQAEATDSSIALVNSKTNPIDGLLTATSDGVITISAHTRDYADGASVSVNAGSVTNTGPFVRVYYMDAARTGGTVTYLATTEEITQTGNVHIIGGVTIPALGDPPSEGTGTTPPGYVREVSENPIP
jgi:hypothetical protein